MHIDKLKGLEDFFNIICGCCKGKGYYHNPESENEEECVCCGGIEAKEE